MSSNSVSRKIDTEQLALKHFLGKVFLKLNFIDYAITVVPIFPPWPLSTQQPHSLRQSPHHCSCLWIIRISTLATPFPILYTPWLFCNYLFVFLNSFTFLPIPLHTPPIWQPLKCSLYPWFCLSSSCLLSLFFRVNCW